MTDSGKKRTRDEEEGSDSLPLSKRITLLHLDSNTSCNQAMGCSSPVNGLFAGNSPPHLVSSDAASLQHPWGQADNPSHIPAVVFSSDISTQWNSSLPSASSLCQHQINTDTATVCDVRLMDTRQMALRLPSDLDPAVVRDLLHCGVYDPELGATENPEYFHINSVLFAAHQLRSERYSRALFEN